MLAAGPPWLADVTGAVTAGTLSVAAAEAIATGLGSPSADVAADDLADAAGRLVEVAGHTTPEKIAAAARAVRDDLDFAGVTDREEHLRSKRFLKLIPRPDGSTRLIGLLDPESAGVLIAAEDAVTAPRRGGPRFVDPNGPPDGSAQNTIEDPRTTEQIALDAFVDMIRIATRADEGKVFAQRQPSLRVHVTLADLERRKAATEADRMSSETQSAGPSPDADAPVCSRDSGREITPGSPGYGFIEGSTAPLGLETIERLGCVSGYIPILFENGQPLKLGRSQRLFSSAQRIALAARDGGCIFPGCDRPPSWCEAHHVRHWHRDHGNTDIIDGVLLCHHHHRLTHNHGWEIERTPTGYCFIPPATLDPDQTPRAAQRHRRLIS